MHFMDKIIFLLSLSVFAVMLGTALLGDTEAYKTAQINIIRPNTSEN